MFGGLIEMEEKSSAGLMVALVLLQLIIRCCLIDHLSPRFHFLDQANTFLVGVAFRGDMHTHRHLIVMTHHILVDAFFKTF